MEILQRLSVFALQQVIGDGAPGLIASLSKHFSDHSQRIVHALQLAADRAWKAFELALAGTSWWDKIKSCVTSADDRAFAHQVRTFIEGLPLSELEGKERFRQQCLEDLRRARKEDLLTRGHLVPAELARQAGGFVGTDQQVILTAQWQALQGVSDALNKAGYSALAWLVSRRPEAGTPLLVAAVRFFFRLSVETDAELARGLTFSQLDTLSQAQQVAFKCLNAALMQHAQRLDQLLGGIREVVVDTNARVKNLEAQIQKLLDQNHLGKRELRPRDSLSIRNPVERQMVKKLVEEYRSLPEQRRKQFPELLGSLGKLQVAAGQFAAARDSLRQAADLMKDDRAKGEAHYNAYQAALEQRDWPGALEHFLQAVRLDPTRFKPFPIDRYQPQRILGAGGFGVVFLCRHKFIETNIVVKALQLDELERDVQNVFNEARVMKQFDDPGFVRITDGGYVDDASQSRPYLVMDYFEGKSLEEYVQQSGPLSLADLKSIMVPIAKALQQAHTRSILHRDVKPGNILIRKEETGWRAKLIDFGLALKQATLEHTFHSPAGHDESLTGGSIAGTLRYAAPEQMAQVPGFVVGPSSDVYGFGRTCYFALFGTPEPDEIMKKDLPKGWRDFLSGCVAHPKNRFRDFEVVLEKLGRFRTPGMRAGRQGRKSAEASEDSDEESPDSTADAPPPAAPPLRSFEIACPRCKAHLQVQESHSGSVLVCPGCKVQFRVPTRPGSPSTTGSGGTGGGSQQTEQKPASGTATATVTIGCPHCHGQLRVSPTWVGRSMKCPTCSGAFSLKPQAAGSATAGASAPRTPARPR